MLKFPYLLFLTMIGRGGAIFHCEQRKLCDTTRSQWGRRIEMFGTEHGCLQRVSRFDPRPSARISCVLPHVQLVFFRRAATARRRLPCGRTRRRRSRAHGADTPDPSLSGQPCRLRDGSRNIGAALYSLRQVRLYKSLGALGTDLAEKRQKKGQLGPGTEVPDPRCLYLR